MFGMGAGEWVLVLLIILVVFGATKLPQLGDGLGRAIKNFKRAVSSANEIEVAPKKGEIPSQQTPPGTSQSGETTPKASAK
jgi:sec-independent protein translocase protein TatA